MTDSEGHRGPALRRGRSATRHGAERRAVDVDEGGAVAALAVDEHQRLVWPQAAQGGRVDVVGTVGAGLAVGVEGGRHKLQQLVQVQLA